ncbi:sigma-54 dependent transcriptional regulator [Desulfurispirillum indicum]|uniref:Sigma-54 factor interaction domain-containing protein n=1 Tax=Desulfurispirillum indicum (strain ATCC BAA-1389 / DSM 22839 / S5) TaxID=653733 RepID=E6W3M3_DESIS|nr:sigma-54 dependent transcriptional regulator [Desulfurispirillum indicum]ADU66904.1 sigma-54 factor interaction domain-containing protein [Desulfurispirillum indicum S5]UCZ56220.1 sigma-54 dependent transcriptional regulator [Desulfurispirillum indicum]
MSYENASILIVEDDLTIGEHLVGHYGSLYSVVWCSDIASAIETVSSHTFDLVLLDMHLPDGEGTQVLQILPDAPGSPQAIILTAFPEHQMAVRTIKMGALDYLEKPFDLDDLDLIVAKALQQSYSRQKLALGDRQRVDALDSIKGDSDAVNHVKELISTIAQSPDTTVLITGETGTGKELVAQAIHELSARRSRPIVRVNCAALPSSLIEAELFGYEKGAYTDAKKSRKGYIEMAAGGTLFLDEIGELGLEVQSKLLRFLEAKTFTKIGGEREIQVDVRVIAATNRDMARMLEDKSFRSDLYYRLNVVQINLPTLRERSGDISTLLRHYITHYCQRMGRPVLELGAEILAEATAYHWPGNVRELRNVAERTALLGTFPSLLGDGRTHQMRQQNGDSTEEAFKTLADVERELIIATYHRLQKNKTRTAEVLGINRVTLRKKLEEYGVQ